MTQLRYPAFAALTCGQRASITRGFQPADLAAWCELAAVETFPDQVPEPLISGLFSNLLGTQLPGNGTMYLKQTLDFSAQAELGEVLTAEVIVTRLRPDKALVDLETRCTGKGGRNIGRGQALVLFRQ